MIASAVDLLRRAASLGRPGRYQLQAAIAATHAEASSWEATDWPEIVNLYGLLLALEPSPVIRLNRAIARRHTDGSAAALMEVDALAAELDSYYLLHATRAELLRELGRETEARAALGRALSLTENPAERRLLERRLAT